jgi:hypothetical protein
MVQVDAVRHGRLEPHAGTTESALHLRERFRRAVAGKHQGYWQDGVMMAVLARCEQFAGVGGRVTATAQSGGATMVVAHPGVGSGYM